MLEKIMEQAQDFADSSHAGVYCATVEKDLLRNLVATLQAERDTALHNLKGAEAVARMMMDNDKRLSTIRKLCGHIEDGSGDYVTIGQDDATGDWTLRVGSRDHYGESFNGLLDGLEIN